MLEGKNTPMKWVEIGKIEKFNLIIKERESNKMKKQMRLKKIDKDRVSIN